VAPSGPKPLGDATIEIVVLALLASMLTVRRRCRRALARGAAARACAAFGSAAVVALLASGCARAPTPLRPGFEGSIGLPHRGVLVGGARLEETPNRAFLRKNDRRWVTPRFARALVRAAERVASERPGGVLVVGDLSAKTGGVLLPHLSHRSGRDADLLLYLTTLDGAPVRSPGFVHVREDGLAWDERGKRFLRFDVERQWLLLKALLSDEEAVVQFVFASKTLRSLLAEWAIARGEPIELVYRAVTVLVQPHPGGEHDDHFHVRTACTDEEVATGCERSGPERPWLATAHDAHDAHGALAALGDGAAKASDDAELVRALFEPLVPDATATASATAAAPSRSTSSAPSARGAP
jgi:penicillin-insensitive murein endopeptidase